FSRITGNKLSPAPSSPTTSIMRNRPLGGPPQTDGVGPVRQRGHFQQHFDFGDEGAWIRQPEGRTKCVERDHCPLLVQFQPAVLSTSASAVRRKSWPNPDRRRSSPAPCRPGEGVYEGNCPSRKSYPRIAMMQSGQDWCGDDGPRSLYGSS